MPNARRFPPPWTIGEKTMPALLFATTTARARQQDHFSNNFRGDGCSVDVIGTSAASHRTSAIDRRFALPAMRNIKIIALVLVGFFLSVPHAATAHTLDEARELNERAFELYKAGLYSEAISLAQRTLALVEKALGPDHPDVATSLNNLADLYRAQGRYADAEPLYKRSLAIHEKVLGPDHPNVALSLNNLAGLYLTQGRYAEAIPLAQRALTIRERALGPDHPDIDFARAARTRARNH
jgi:tetratricopeptide (TPR) repeat protein